MFKKIYKFVVDMIFFVVLWFDGRVVFGSSVSRFNSGAGYMSRLYETLRFYIRINVQKLSRVFLLVASKKTK